jgi:hypothetical protein
MRFAARTTPQSPAVRRAAFALAAAVWAVALARAWHVFGPGSVYVQPFNSDSALPVMMANDPVIDAFRTYVYGQDQIGAWPFLFAQLAARATGCVWTAEGVYRWQALWLMLGVVPFALLGRSLALLPGALLLSVLFLHPNVSHYLFVLNQRYAWQVGALCFAWWALRRVCEREFGVSGDGDGPRGVLASRWLWILLAFWFSLLAVWMSPLSALMLLAFLALEAARARLLAAGDAPRPRPTRLLACLLPVAAAVAAEQAIKANHRRFSLKHFGKEFRTPTSLDWGHLSENFLAQAEQLAGAPWFWLTAAGLVAGAAAAACLLSSAACSGRAPVRACEPGARLDASVLLAGSCAAALINFAAAVLFEWVRLNLYGARYLALTHLFGALAGLLAIFLCANMSRKVYSARGFFSPLSCAAAVAVLMLLTPPARENPQYRELKGVAAELARRAPGGVLLGGYWDTYVFAALEPAARFMPVPAEDQLLRTPWTPRLMRESPRVLVVHHAFAPSAEVETPAPYNTFGDGRDPPPSITQHGTTLRLAAPRWLERGGYVFSLYDNDRAPLQ